MSGVFDSVMTELATGSSARTAARKLGISLDLAQAVAEQATRMGLVVSGGSACGTCAPATSPACGGCPFSEGKVSQPQASSTGARGGPTPVTLILRPHSR